MRRIIQLLAGLLQALVLSAAVLVATFAVYIIAMVLLRAGQSITSFLKLG